MSIRLLGLVALIMIASSSIAADSRSTDTYFGYLNTKCGKEGGKPEERDEHCEKLRTQLRTIGTLCKQTDKDESCEPVRKALANFFQPYVPKLPKFVAYFDQCQEQDPTTKACKSADAPVVRHGPVLMWDDRNTAHVYGARQVYAIVFADQKACLTGRVTTNYKSEPNPIPVLFAAIGTKLDTGTTDAKAPESKPFKFTWIPLSGSEGTKPSMWLAVAGVTLEENTVNWITLLFANHPAEKDDKQAGAGAGKPAKKASKKGDAKDAEKGDDSEQLPDCDLEKSAEPANASSKKPVNTTPGFSALSGFFSNSPGGYATVGIAMGATRNVQDTTISSGGSHNSFNAYATVKWYLIRPRLRPIKDSDCWTPQWMTLRDTTRCPSLGIFFGTNIAKDKVFQQVIYGVSVGHIWDNVGIVFGKNSIAGGDIEGGGKQDGRRQKNFIGIDYSF